MHKVSHMRPRYEVSYATLCACYYICIYIYIYITYTYTGLFLSSSSSELDWLARSLVCWGGGLDSSRALCHDIALPPRIQYNTIQYITHTYTHTYTHTHIHTYTPTHLHTYTPTHIQIYSHIHIHTYTHTHVYTYNTHVYAHTHIHVYTHVHRFLCWGAASGFAQNPEASPAAGTRPNSSGGTKRATSANAPLLHLQSSGENSQCLAKPSPYADLSAGAEVVRLRKWHVWRLLAVAADSGVLAGRLLRLELGPDRGAERHCLGPAEYIKCKHIKQRSIQLHVLN